MTKFKKVLVLILIAVLFVSLLLLVFSLKKNESTLSNVQLEALGEKSFDIIPLSIDNSGLALDSDLMIICKEEEDLSKIKKSFMIEPSEAYKIVKVSSQEYLVDFQTELKANTVYRISMNNNDSELSWAFQTVRSLNLVSTLPRDKGTEVPLNSGIELEFSYPYIKGLEDSFIIEPKVEGKFTYYKNLAVFMPDKLEPDTLYTVTIKAGIGIEGSEKVTDEDYTFQFLTQSKSGSRRSYFNFSESLYNFTSDSIPYIQVFASDNLRNKEMSVDIYKYTNEDDFIFDIKELNDSNYYWRSMVNKNVKLDSHLNKVISFTTNLITDGKYGTTYFTLPNEINEGYYLINVNSEDANYQSHLQVNDASIYIMYGEKESIAWVNDTKTGNAISGATFKAENNSSAITNNEGIAIIKGDSVSKNNNNQVFFKVAFNNRPTYVAKMENNYVYDFYYYGNQQNNNYWSYLYMDREIYLPSDKISFWGLVKPRNNGEKINSVSVSFNRSEYYNEKSEIEVKNVVLDEFGCFDGDMVFKDLIPGRYKLEIKYNDDIIATKYFEVRNFEKPAFKIETVFDKEKIFGWEAATLNIQANFFEGSPVSGLKLGGSYYENNQSKVIDNIISNNNGFSQYKYSPVIKTDDWHPVYVNFNLYNTQAEDYNIWTNKSILVFPKNVMYNIDIASSEDNAVINIQTNMIDINKESKTDGYLSYKDRYMGVAIDRDIEISIYEITYTRSETGQYYDFINKVVQKTYRYYKNTDLIDKINATTKNGIYSMNLELQDGKNYEISVKGFDTKGNQVIQKSYIDRYRYYDSYYEDTNYYIVEEDESKDKYKEGDKISLKLVRNNEDVMDKEGDRILYLKLKDGLQTYDIKESVKNSYVFKESDIPNYYYCGIYFDGKHIYLVGYIGINYDYSDKMLDISLKTDKDNYKPGDTVKLEFTVKNNKGDPQKANVNISIVDEAIFALREQYVDTIADVYKYTFGTGIIQNHVSHRELSYNSMAEKGSGGDYYEYIRSDFKDTASFNTLTTGSDGKGNINFKLPDNLTSWRITYQGITKDLFVGNGKININTKLPYFITLIKSDIYMIGDNPAISIRSFGTETDENDTIEYTVTLESQNGKKETFTLNSRGNEYANIKLGELKKGKYYITVEGKNGALYDGIKEEFEVVDSMLKTTLVDFIELNKNTRITNTEGYTNIAFYNKANSLYYNTLASLSYVWGNRVDQQIVKKIASDLISEYFDKNINHDKYQFDKYQNSDGGITLLPYSSSNALLSAKISSLSADLFDKYRLKEYFYNVIKNQKSTEIDTASAYWGLAALKEPVLIDIQNVLNNDDLSIKGKILLGLGLLEFGDINGAKSIYVDVMNNYGKKMGEYIYIDVGIDRDDKLEATSLVSIMSLRLNTDEKHALLEYVTHNKTETILTYLEQLMFVMYDLPGVAQEVSFSYVLDGKENDVKLKNSERYTLYLSEEQAKNIKFKDIDGDVAAAISYYGNLKNSGVSNTKSFTISRSYTSSGNMNNLKQSDVIKVMLKPSFSESAPDGYYEITDVIPAGMRYIKSSNEYSSDNMSYPLKNDASRITFGYYYIKGKEVMPITYYLRVAAPGKYIADNAIILHYGSNAMSQSERNTFNIE